MRAKRILAFIIDALIIGVLTSVIVYGFTDLRAEEITRLDWGVVGMYDSAWYIHFLISVLYFLMDGIYGKTIGKRIMNIRVAAQTAGNIGFFKAAIRSLVKVVSINLLVGIILFFFMKSNSSLHDRAAKTQVL